MLLHDLRDAGLEMPAFVPDATAYLTVMGSVAYGVSTDMSDMDLYGFAIPPMTDAFPHLRGYVHGFDPSPNAFKVFDRHKFESKGIEYDFAIYSITHYFRLVMGANPNMLDSLYTPDRCVLHMSKIGQMVRDQRSVFVSQEVRTKYKGFAYAELQRALHQKNVQSETTRARIAQYGYNVKAAYHVVRLLLEAEQMLLSGEMDLEAHVPILTAIRAGEWSREKIEAFNEEMMVRLEATKEVSKLPLEADEAAVKQLLLNCLEEHYGYLPDTVK